MLIIISFIITLTETKILIVFDDMIPDMSTNNKFQSIVKEPIYQM